MEFDTAIKMMNVIEFIESIENPTKEMLDIISAGADRLNAYHQEHSK